MVGNTLILALLLAGAPGAVSYRIELKSGAYLIAADQPRDNGVLILFHLAPRGPLTSLKKSEVARVVPVPTKTDPTVLVTLRPGGQVILGSTGGSGGGSASATVAPAAQTKATLGGGPLRPGERPDGTALFNPDRPYRPDWDSRRVPGLNMPFPASPNDYREGRTIAYPPASAVQSAPGQPPMMPPSTGEVPRSPNP